MPAMSQSTKLIAFDCWGTVFTNAQKPHPFAVFAKRLGRDLLDRPYVALFERNLMTDVYTDLTIPIRQLLDDLGIDVTAELLSELEHILLDSTQSQVAFPETAEALEALGSKYRLAMITNTFKQGFEQLCSTDHVRDYFEMVLTSYEEHHVKPDHHMFKTLIERSGVRPEEMLFVGDSISSDMAPAESMGMHTILIDREGKFPDFPRRITSLTELS